MKYIFLLYSNFIHSLIQNHIFIIIIICIWNIIAIGNIIIIFLHLYILSRERQRCI